MQDGWCGDDTPLPGGRPPGWEDEEDVEIGMWDSTSSRELSASLNWPPYTKKMSSKVGLPRRCPRRLKSQRWSAPGGVTSAPTCGHPGSTDWPPGWDVLSPHPHPRATGSGARSRGPGPRPSAYSCPATHWESPQPLSP